MNRPKVLYKFEAINEYSLRNLKNASLYFNKPSSFNDPFDCSIMNNSVVLSDGDFVRIFNHMLDTNEIFGFSRASSKNDLPVGFEKQVTDGLKRAIEKKQNECLHNLGCTCFSETNSHLLMWSHYANGHKGMCLEFDTSVELFNKVYNVSYSDEFPKFNPVNVILNKNNKEFNRDTFEPLLTKFICWGYEQEWRAFHKEPNKLYTYPVGSLKSVYFGVSTERADMEIVCLILLGQNKKVKFYRGTKSTKKFEIEFEEFTYTPYIETI